MGKFDLNSMKRQREEKESQIISTIPDKLEQSYVDIWGSNNEKVVYIELYKIVEYTDSKGRKQPFNISEKKIEQIKTSAKDIGIITPIIVRKHDDKYQIISGHHRYLAAKELELLTIPCIIRDISDDNAFQYVSESNIQRNKLLPSEYAKIYSVYIEKRSDINMTVQEIADKFNISKKSIYRYIKILDLTENLQTLINNNMLHVDTAEIFFKLSETNQEIIYKFVIETKTKINRAAAKKIYEFFKCHDNNASIDELKSLLLCSQPVYKNEIYNKLSAKFNFEYSEKELDNLSLRLLEDYFNANSI